jgi:serine/threonine protein kinase
MPADPNRVRDVFLAAVELPPEQRPVYLAEACGADGELRAEVDRLLVANADSDSILDSASSQYGTVDFPDKVSATHAFDPDAPSPMAIATEVHRPDGLIDSSAEPDPVATRAAETGAPAPRAARLATSEGIGTVIAGRYTLVDMIGQGGMGSVYLAGQTEPVKRQVALKLIKTGMDSKAVLARFDAERQTLALMDHPNIARIYDGGVTPAGYPFFVMELVKGVPLTAYCDQQRLTVQARLELFVSVCQAVQHAHQKGIIHRDLKPGNVLVTEVDGRPTPKVIDFGVAKATEVKLTDMSLADVGAIVGTPAYMSPEQADPTSMDIDTRTDVYALGVMLYELLTGAPPIDAKQFQRGAILEMLRMVREVDPPRPSTKLSTADALPNIAANRSIEPARLAQLLQGELDWVVMKALEKDRTRRYETASGFARDIERYLADEVVEARPPSRGYRLQKFVKRNKVQVIAATLVLLTLLAGIVGTSWGMWQANRARVAERDRADGERSAKIDAQRARDAEAKQRALADAQRDKAREEAAKSQTINDFLTKDLLTQAEPANNSVEDKVTLLEVLDRAAEKVGTRFADQPELESSLRWTIAQTYHGLASWAKAEAQWRAVLEAARKRDPRSAEAYQAQGLLAHILFHRGRPTAEYLEMAEAAAKGLERTLGPDHPATLITLKGLAAAFQADGKLPEAIALYERIRDAEIATLGPDHLDTLITLNNLAAAYQTAGRLPEAIALYERVRDAPIAKLGPDHPKKLTTLSNLAGAYREVGKLPEAIALFERVRDAQIAKQGPDHPDTLITLNNLAGAYRAAGRLAEAIALRERVRDAQIPKLGPDHPDTLKTISGLAAAYWSSKQLARSVPLFESVLKLQEAKLGRQHPDTQATVANLGVNYKDAGRLKEAIPLLEEAHQAAKNIPALRWIANPLIDAYATAGENAKLADLLKEELAGARKALPKDSPRLASLLVQSGMVLLQQKMWTEAEPLLRECLAIREKTQPDVWSTFNTKSMLGAALLGQKKHADAEPLLLAGYEGMKQREKTIPEQGKSRPSEAVDRLIELSTATNKPDEVKKWQAERAKYPKDAAMPKQKK